MKKFKLVMQEDGTYMEKSKKRKILIAELKRTYYLTKYEEGMPQWRDWAQQQSLYYYLRQIEDQLPVDLPRWDAEQILDKRWHLFQERR